MKSTEGVALSEEINLPCLEELQLYKTFKFYRHPDTFLVFKSKSKPVSLFPCLEWIKLLFVFMFAIPTLRDERKILEHGGLMSPLETSTPAALTS